MVLRDRCPTTFILLRSRPSTSQSYAGYSNSSLIWEKLKQDDDSLTYFEMECQILAQILGRLLVAHSVGAHVRYYGFDHHKALLIKRTHVRSSPL